MFGLLYNLYKYVKKKSERKLTLAVLGLDNSGKTTFLNTMRGELDKEVTPSFGFSSQKLTEGKYTIEVFDLGGGKNIRRIWKTYFPEVHGIIYMVDAADQERFAESKEVLEQTLTHELLTGKPVLLLANKQDLPASATAAEVATALNLAGLGTGLRYNILPCIAKTPPGQEVDGRLREGVRWLVNSVDSIFHTLDVRVQADAQQAREEELRKKREREEKVRALKEERLRKQQEEEEQQRLAQATATVENSLALLPNQIESPGKVLQPREPTSAPPVEFSDLQLQRPDQSRLAAGSGTHASASIPVTLGPDSPTPTALPGVRNPVRLQAVLGEQPDQSHGNSRGFVIPPHNRVAPEDVPLAAAGPA